MKKYLLSLLLLIPNVSQAAKIAVTVGDGTLQPGTTMGFNVSSGTVSTLKFATATSTGSLTLSTGAFTMNSGTATFSASTITHTGAFYTGTMTDRSTRTFDGGYFSGTRNDNSTTTFVGAAFNGTKTDNSTTSFTASNDFGNQRLQNISSATVAGDAARYSQVKYVGFISSSVATSSTTTQATFGKTNLTASITPKSTSNQIKITTSFTATTSNIGNTCEYKITRNGSDITNGPVMDYGGASAGTNSLTINLSMTGVDSPSSTSSTTYEVSFRNLSGGITCGLGSGVVKSTIILEEINGL